MLAVSAAFLGLAVMAAAWWLPDRLASGRIRRALVRVQRRISTGGRSGGRHRAQPDEKRRR